ncbi:MAG: hypothetical protein ABIK43_02315, partial [candidate division WOR-3 bacterium]
MENLVQKFRQQLGRKQYDELDETWLELIEGDQSMTVLLALADLVEQWGPPGKAFLLLSLLNDHLHDENRFSEQMTVLRRLARMAPADASLARDIASCLRRLHPNVEILDRILQKVGI